MRFDLPDEIPHDLPRRQDTKQAPLDQGPVERRREQLNERAAENRGPQLPLPRRERSREIHQPREAHERTRTLDHPSDRRPARRDLPLQAIALRLREEEQKVLAEAGKFRVIATRDLGETVYGNRVSRMDRDLAFLKQEGLIEINAVNARRDGRGGRIEHLEVVTLTKAGRDLTRQIAELPEGQKLYAGLVKPREVEHDTQIYRAYRKEAERIEAKGGRNLRVELDFEIKSKVQKAIYAERKANPNRDLNEIKQQVAEQFDLAVVNNTIQIPDARIEYDTDQGPRTGHEDIEVLTAAYRPGHVQGKVQAGFHLYASASDRASLTARVEGDHHLLDNILEL